MTPHIAQGPVDVTVGPVAWAVFADNGNIRIWSSASEPVRKLAEAEGMKLVPLHDISALRALIADDSYAMTFQSMGQYRSALLKAMAPNAELCGGEAVRTSAVLCADVGEAR